jgi:MFS family permease
MMIASFGLYFCTYAVRKPFSSGIYENLYVWGLNYKVVLIFAQVFGYMISKIVGIKIISEINKSKRIFIILGLVSFSLFSLLLFALIKPPFNIIFIFFNGLPLGLIYGLIFSFLEGRRVTELLGIALSINLVMTSGILKSVYLWLQIYWNVSEMWLPFLIGSIFLVPFLFFLWMLSKVKEPSIEDIKMRTERLPMTKNDKKSLLDNFGYGIFSVALIYTLFTVLRDFRDNFSFEIWKELNTDIADISIFARYESIIALVVMIIIGLLVVVKNNFTAFKINSALIIISILVLFVSTTFFDLKKIN